MNLLILGATGRVGGRVAALALADGHRVTALVRSPGGVGPPHERLTVVEGNAMNRSDVRRALQGCDAVVSALGTDGTTTLSTAIPLLAEIMTAAGVRRIVTIGTAGILDSRLEPGVLRYRSSESRRSTTFAAEEHERAFLTLQASALDWTIVCPPYMPDGARTDAYRTERDRLPEGGTVVSAADVAAFAYAQVGSAAFLRTRVGIAY